MKEAFEKHCSLEGQWGSLVALRKAISTQIVVWLNLAMLLTLMLYCESLYHFFIIISEYFKGGIVELM